MPDARLASLPCLALLLFASLGAQAEAATVARADLQATITFERDAVRIMEGDGYHLVGLDGATVSSEGERPGAPSLPVAAVRFALPAGTMIAAARVEGREVERVGSSVLPAPACNTASDEDAGAGEAHFCDPDPAIYSSFEAYPTDLLVDYRTGWMRGRAIGTVLVSPVRYVGAGGELLLHRTIDVSIELQAVSGDMTIVERDRARTGPLTDERVLAWLRERVVNPDALEPTRNLRLAGGGAASRPFSGFVPTELPSTDGPPVAYVIVTDNVTTDGRPVGDVAAELQRLADWKTQTGTPAVVRTVSWIREHYSGHDDPSRIRAFLIDAFRYWGTDYVLLGGDLEIVPARRFSGANLGAGDPPAEVYYGGLDNDWDLDNDGVYGELVSDLGASDPYWDLWVGRAPIEDAEEAAIFVDKSLSYVRVPGADIAGLDPTYYDRAVLLAGLANCATWARTCNGIYVAETILRRLAPPAMAVERIYQQLLDPSPTCTYHETYLEVADSTQTAWTTAAALEALNGAAGFVHHFEHSNPYTEGGASGGFGCAVLAGGALGREYIDQLTNGPNWSIVYSTGAGVNAFDYDSVSEHWILNPHGGAVAYVGKTRSGSVTSVTGEVDTLFFESVFRNRSNLGQALAFATQSLPVNVERAVSSFALLGDPELQPWITRPDSLAIEVTPAAIGPGAQLVGVTLRDAGSQEPAAGRVCLAQSDRLYAFGDAGADGTVGFAVEVNDADDLVVTATAPGFLPAVITVPVVVAPAPRMAYASHQVFDDSTAVANANGVVDAGEVIKLDVGVRNEGTVTAVDAHAELQVAGAVELEVNVDGGCAPEALHLGASGQHPAGCIAAFPELEFRGIDPVGRPRVLGDTAEPGLFVWREGATWTLVARGPAASGELELSGAIAVRGHYDDLQTGGLEPGDQVTGTDLETLDFDLVASSGGDLDSLTFVARESAWLEIATGSAMLGDVAPGGTAGGRFIIATTSTIPDRHEPRLEIGVVTGGGVAAGRSSFSLQVAAPVLEYARQSASGAAPLFSLAPVIRNGGSGVAGDVAAVLHLRSGAAAISDSLVVVGELAPGAESDGNGAFELSTTDTLALRLAVLMRNRYPDGSTRTWIQERIDIVRPCAVAGVLVEPTAPGSGRLKWSAPDPGCAADLAGFNVYRRHAGGDTFVRVGAAGRDSTRMFTEIALEPDTTYVYAVAARDSSGNESAWSQTIAATTWVPQHPGWPHAVDAGGPSSPLVAEVDGDGELEILALGNALYGWNADGTPLVAADGEIFRMPRPPESMSLGSTAAFLGSPAAADLDGDGAVEVVMAAWDDSLWVVHADGELLWGRRCIPKWSSPALGDLDGDGDLEVVIGSDQPRVYAWHHDGSPVVASNPDGTFAELADGAYINYTTPSLADIDGDPATEEVIHASFRGNVYAWDGTGALLWAAAVGAVRPLSTPAIGDLDEDGTLEVVVAQGNQTTGPAANAIHVIDAASGNVDQSWSGSTQIPGRLFGAGNYIHPPALADLDGNGDLEIVVGTSGVTASPPHLSLIGAGTVLVFEDDAPGAYAAVCQDTIPEPGLNMTNFSQQSIDAQPVIADVDGDGVLEIAAGSTTSSLFLFQSPGGAECEGESGWPLLFAGEVSATPYVGDVTGDGNVDLVARVGDGSIHLFDLGAAYVRTAVEWPQFAFDTRHTSRYVEAGATHVEGAPPAPRLRLLQSAPNPSRGSAVIAYEVPGREMVSLRIYGVDGRLVRTIAHGLLAPGRHQARWDGRDGRGAPVASGVYFYELQVGARSLSRKLLIVH